MSRDPWPARGAEADLRGDGGAHDGHRAQAGGGLRDPGQRGEGKGGGHATGLAIETEDASHPTMLLYI